MNEGVESKAWSSFQSPKRAHFVPWAGRPGKEATGCHSPAPPPSARSITSSGSHSGKELQSSTGRNKEVFPRASWPPRSPARADSTSQCLSSGCYREVTRLDWTEQAGGMVPIEASSFQVGRADISRAGTKWPDMRGAGKMKGRVTKP